MLCDLHTLETEGHIQIDSVEELRNNIEDVWENSDPLDDTKLVGQLEGEVSVFNWHWQDGECWDLEISASQNF